MAKMTRDELLNKLEEIAARHGDDPENDHWDADVALLEFIDDVEITAAYNGIHKWYA